MNAANVRPRIDGRGDDFANAHRLAHRDLYFTDVDARIELWGQLAIHGEDQEFFEYCIASNGQRIETAIVAWFDRKKPRFDWCEQNEVMMRTRHPFMGLCRDLGRVYPVTPRFFWICGSSGPWDLVEWNPMNGLRMRTQLLQTDSINEAWKELELLSDRRIMLRWLQRGKK